MVIEPSSILSLLNHGIFFESSNSFVFFLFCFVFGYQFIVLPSNQSPSFFIALVSLVVNYYFLPLKYISALFLDIFSSSLSAL